MAILNALRMLALAGALSAFGASCKRAEPLPELGALAPFSLQDQEGRQVTADSLRGRPWVAAFVFTRCPTVCPRITARMKDLQSEARRRGAEVRFVSVSVDPEYDTPSVLAAYAQRHGLDLSNWSLLTGDFAVIRTAAEKSFKIGVDGKADAAADHYGITHGSHLVLVDGALTIRGYYRSADDDEMKRLLADLERLGER
jgi:protein SCO1/2